MSPPIIPKIAHVILAAGSSSRMGTPKQLLPWRDSTLITYAIEQSLAITKLSTYVVLGANYDLIYDHIYQFPVTLVRNTEWKNGMGSSIRCGIKSMLMDELSYDAVLISLIDQPLIDHVYFDTLLTKYYQNTNPIVASDLGNRIGVPAIFSASVFNELELLKEDYGARFIIKKRIDKVLTVPAIDIGVDLDTIQQYHALLQGKLS